MELSCGGPPGASAKVDREYRQRSPLTWLAQAKGVALDINAGIHDGHTGSVPISHSLLAFNAVVPEKDRISGKDIAFMTKHQKVPKHLQREIKDAAYGKKRPLFRAKAGAARVTIFEGGHELIAKPALLWLQKQRKKK